MKRVDDSPLGFPDLRVWFKLCMVCMYVFSIDPETIGCSRLLDMIPARSRLS